MNTKPAGSSRLITILWIGIVTLALVVAMTFAVKTVPNTAYNFAKKVAKDVKEALGFTPQVRIGEAPPIILQSTPVLQLVSIKQPSIHRYPWSQTWGGSMKTLYLEGDFSAQAGFDLKKPFALSINEKSLSVTARMPAPELFAVEMIHYRVIQDEDGWWNKITPQDREDALNALLARARKEVLRSGILKAAQESFEQQLDALIRKQGAPVVTYEVAPRN